MEKKAFTLIELLIVVIIVGILAAIVVPMMSSITKRAIASEAIAALGAILNAERAYYLEYNSYATYGQLNSAGLLRIRGDNGIYGSSDLDGTYFSQECYKFNEPYTDGQHGFALLIEFHMWRSYWPAGWTNRAPKADIVLDWDGDIWMDDKGNIYSSFEWLGYPDAPWR
ncbi:MAG: hypothetical protein A2987_06330 [Omnitrophica bacterium RIFCSPLOWO2_01_FULL_45_10]|nr:MAG: hypothetical protein A2987_06330 [Omnitrophica bacterium RIFCSPLOWO2_01_FULL_45_10]